MATKATPADVRPGRMLWLKDHGEWIPVVVEGTTPSPRGIKVVFHHPAEGVGQRLLDALYRTAPASDGGPRRRPPGSVTR